MSTKPASNEQEKTASSAPSETPAEGRTYVVKQDQVSCLVDKINVKDGGILAIGEFRGQKVISREAVDAKTGKKVTRHRLAINLESIDASATPIAIEFNGWEVLPAELPFRKGDHVVARIIGEFNGTYSIDAAAQLQ